MENVNDIVVRYPRNFALFANKTGRAPQIQSDPFRQVMQQFWPTIQELNQHPQRGRHGREAKFVTRDRIITPTRKDTNRFTLGQLQFLADAAQFLAPELANNGVQSLAVEVAAIVVKKNFAARRALQAIQMINCKTDVRMADTDGSISKALCDRVAAGYTRVLIHKLLTD
jgi:hypothetical protein